MKQFETLPSDMIFHVMQYCDFDQLSSLMMLSGEWFRISLRFGFHYKFTVPTGNCLEMFKLLSDRSSSLLITSLSMEVVSNEIIEIFVNSPNLKRLNSLELKSGVVQEIEIAKLFNSPIVSNLTSLTFRYLIIDDKGFKALCESPFMKHLTKLEWSWAGNTDEVAKYISESENLSNLTSLSGDQIDESCKYLFASPVLSNLKHLHLSNSVDDDLLKSLAESPYITKLETLDMDRAYFSHEGLKLFLNSNNAKNITELDVEFSDQFGNEGARILSECPNMINLKTLNCKYTDFSDEGVRHILRSQYLGNLTELHHYPEEAFDEGEYVTFEMNKNLKQFLETNKNKQF